ncbi:hypothetical protein C8R42DRAFT_722295 [Lentinula raphanica]|nr:hypothetical protein C8R42DRAFT_722295 [Lentinula raphanica]
MTQALPLENRDIESVGWRYEQELIVDTLSLFFATMAIIDSFCLPGSPLDELQRELTYRTWWEPQSRDDSKKLKLLKHRNSPSLSLARDNHCSDLGGPDTTRYEISRLPELINIFSAMIRPIPNGPPLMLTQLAPFVTKRNSTVLYTTVADAIDDVWSKLDKSTISIKLKLTTHNSLIHSVSSPPGLPPSSPSPLSSPSSVAVDVASHPPPLPESLLIPPHSIRTGPYKTHPVVSHKNFFSAMSCREISRIDRRGNLKVTSQDDLKQRDSLLSVLSGTIIPRA